ncbi:MAG TPA: hypothetical protein VMF89_00555, partial [Polyangiales bacterium]|nr:hypothetical protein [Polyangiales bacterium]
AVLSPAERAILNELDPKHFVFGGSEAVVVAQVTAAQARISAIEQQAPPDMSFKPVFARERAIDGKMIAALQPVARSVAARTLLLTIELGQAEDIPLEASTAMQKKAQRLEVKYAKALLALHPADVQVTFQLVSALTMLGHPGQGLQYARMYAHKYPGATTYQTMAWYYEFNKNVAEQALWEGKLLQLQRRQAATEPTDANLESVADQARYLGSLEAQLGQTQRAMQLYRYALGTIAHIKHPSQYVQLDIQDAESGELALRLAGKTHGVALLIEPWTGAPLPGSTSNTIKYRVVVVAQPNTSVQLQAERYASGWLPSFCSDNLCSPIRRVVSVPSSSVLTIEFQMIPTGAQAPRASPVTVLASAGGSAASSSVVARYPSRRV